MFNTDTLRGRTLQSQASLIPAAPSLRPQGEPGSDSRGLRRLDPAEISKSIVSRRKPNRCPTCARAIFIALLISGG